MASARSVPAVSCMLPSNKRCNVQGWWARDGHTSASQGRGNASV